MLVRILIKFEYYNQYDEPVGGYPHISTVTTYFCGYSCSEKTDAECQSLTGNSNSYFDADSCSCVTPCESDPIPEKTLLEEFSGGAPAQQYCNDIVTSGIYEKDGYTYNNLQCWTDTCGDLSTWDLFGVVSGNPDDDTDGDGILDKCDPDDPNYDYYDCDGDGLSNLDDDDDDGDGILDPYDPDSKTYGQIQNCEGPFWDYYYKPDGVQFPQSSYVYNNNHDNHITCEESIDYSSIDAVYWQFDKEPTCERVYCFQHRIDCNYNALDHLPNGWEYIQNLDSSTCYHDGVEYIDSAWFTPSPNCSLGFCYMKPASNPDTNSTTDEEDEPVNDTDYNSTDPDNSNLEALNNINQGIDNLNDKTDKTNNKLDELKDFNNKILTNNQDMNKKLEDISKKSDNLNSNLDLANTNLQNINSALGTTSNYLNSVNKGVAQINNNIGVTNNLLQDGLFSDTDPFADKDLTDGSDQFDGIESTLVDSLDDFSDKTTLEFNSGVYSLPTISFSVAGTNFTLFEPSMFSDFPIEEIRSLIKFLFALAALVIVIGTI